jgi:hypothetical protein
MALLSSIISKNYCLGKNIYTNKLVIIISFTITIIGLGLIKAVNTIYKDIEIIVELTRDKFLKDKVDISDKTL